MTSNGRAGSTPAFATSVQMMDTSVPIQVHNLAYKAVKNMRVKNVTVLMDTHKANAGAKRNILCEFQHVHLVMMLLMLTSNEQETRVLLVLVFLMMTKHARQVGVQPTPPPGSGALGEAQQRSRLKLLLN